MTYTNDNLNSEELAELYNSSAKNIMFPENPIGYFIYKNYGHIKDDNLFFRMANTNNIFLCDNQDLSKLGERYTITNPSGFTDFEYRLLIAFETFPVMYKAIMEKVLKSLFFDSVNNVEDIYISSNSGNFKYSNQNKTNSLMSDQYTLNDLMDTQTDTFVIFLPESVDKTSLCNVIKYLNLPYTVNGGCPEPVIDVVLLPITTDFYNYIFYPDKIYDISNLNDNYSIEIGYPASKIVINNGILSIESDSYNRINLINNYQFFVNGEHSGTVHNNSINFIEGATLRYLVPETQFTDVTDNGYNGNVYNVNYDSDGGAVFNGNNSIVDTKLSQNQLQTSHTKGVIVQILSSDRINMNGVMGDIVGTDGFTFMNFYGVNFSFISRNNTYVYVPSTKVNEGFNYVVSVIQGTIEKIYLNGELVGSSTSATNFIPTDTNIIIGRGANGANRYMKGKIRAVETYKDKALTADEILQNYETYKAKGVV